MKPDTIYAVIDLETTGTSVKDGDRIIQIGCALVQNGQVIQTLSQLINPDRHVPFTIQKLTGITPKTLLTAPYFEEIGPTLAAMLEDTVIVAHNVNFDYPFLSAELERIGHAPLNNLAIDTVELAQVLLPTMGSFRLSDLTSHLNIEHDNPHQADSDAISTAKLFLKLTKRFQNLPSAVQQQLAHLGSALLRNTGDYLTQLVTPDRPLADNLVQVGPFVLRRQQALQQPLAKGSYPADEAQKRSRLRPQLKFRKTQAKMMDAVYQHAPSIDPLFIEAGTGLGKTLGYLVPYAYLASSSKKLVVTTATLVLQTQMIEQAIPQLNRIVGFDVPAVAIKSPRHYVDLYKLAMSLRQDEPNRLTRVLQMKLLVWLTLTATGDLDELHLTNYQAPLFNQIQHSGQIGTQTTNPFFEVDFYANLLKQVEAASIVITNHAFFSRHDLHDLPLGQKPYLVVDEAHRLADNATSAFSDQLNLGKLKHRLTQLRHAIDHQDSQDLKHVYQGNRVMTQRLVAMLTTAESIQTRIEGMQVYLYRRFFKQRKHVPANLEIVLNPETTQQLFKRFSQGLKQLSQWLPDLMHEANAVAVDFVAHRDQFLISDYATFQDLEAASTGLGRSLDQLTRLIAQEAELEAGVSRMLSLQMRHLDDVTSLAPHWQAISVSEDLQALLATYQAPVFTSATLMVNRSFDFVASQIGYQTLTDSETLRLRSPFHYRDQAQVFLAEDAPVIADMTDWQYADYLANTIEQLADNEAQTIILFNSLSVIAAVYSRLTQRPIASRKEILAQGVTGSAEKIAKRFAIGQQSLLLGAASFFEGIDYPDRLLQIVILTRLPFDAPDQPLVKARYQQLREQGLDPFVSDAIPRATMRLRQSFGRLIRTSHDRGVFIVLDPRLATTKFGRSMQKSLPNIKPKQLPTADIAELTADWLNLNPEEDDHA
ncbi:helicase C-terminal domain-containing protein [Lacticaseibacillus brantae]|uniref:3'-5' exonuclease DinG n=1 Tax=Lacticaseibacillus brantae DSM 23927 TaxID=1423727 RepID=A0A0R2B0U2_9LACO|nr:helicase C-terminal domain-containing protein [Lacticaseibacillus brantae]KRM72677.1 ATP-dependent helicase DinG [Lacticaseibacillus brantae DSM 23927]